MATPFGRRSVASAVERVWDDASTSNERLYGSRGPLTLTETLSCSCRWLHCLWTRPKSVCNCRRRAPQYQNTGASSAAL